MMYHQLQAVRVVLGGEKERKKKEREKRKHAKPPQALCWAALSVAATLSLLTAARCSLL